MRYLLLAFSLTVAVQQCSADLSVWTPAEIDTLAELGPDGLPYLYLMSQSMGYGYYTHLALADHSGAGLPDSFCVHGEFLVSPSDYLDTLPSSCHLQPLCEGAMPVLDGVRSSLPDTLVLLLVYEAFQAEPDTAMRRWALLEGRYRLLD